MTNRIDLVKGGRVSLTKENPNLNEIHVGLGWDVNKKSSSNFDLDASVFMLGEKGKVEHRDNLVYFGNLNSSDGSIKHMGDNLTGDGNGDDEVIKVSLSKVSKNVQKIVFSVSIYQAKRKRQKFEEVQNAYIRIVDKKTNSELVRFNLTEDYSTARSVIVGELYRHNDEWKFYATGIGIEDELDGLKKMFMR